MIDYNDIGTPIGPGFFIFFLHPAPLGGTPVPQPEIDEDEEAIIIALLLS